MNRTTGLVIILLPLLAATVYSADRKATKEESQSKTAVVSEKKETPVTQTGIISPEQKQPLLQPPTPRDPAEGEQVNWKVISGGGGTRTIGDFTLGATVDQTAVGWSTIGTDKLHSGFWQDFGQGDCCQDRGNVDRIMGPFGPVDVADVTYLVAMSWQGGPDPPCIEEGNADGIVGPFGPIDVADLRT